MKCLMLIFQKCRCILIKTVFVELHPQDLNWNWKGIIQVCIVNWKKPTRVCCCIILFVHVFTMIIIIALDISSARSTILQGGRPLDVEAVYRWPVKGLHLSWSSILPYSFLLLPFTFPDPSLAIWDKSECVFSAAILAQQCPLVWVLEVTWRVGECSRAKFGNTGWGNQSVSSSSLCWFWIHGVVCTRCELEGSAC